MHRGPEVDSTVDARDTFFVGGGAEPLVRAGGSLGIRDRKRVPIAELEGQRARRDRGDPAAPAEVPLARPRIRARLLELHLELVDEVERELTPERKRAADEA
jgi:hypothetical protein